MSSPPTSSSSIIFAGRASKTLADALGAVKTVQELGPRAVLVTSLHVDDTPDDSIDMLAADETGRFRLRTPKLPLMVNGAGDAIAALFFAHYLREGKSTRRWRARLRHFRRARQDRGARRAGNPAYRRAAGDRRAEQAVRGGRDLSHC